MMPAVIIALCVVAGLATWLMLPSRRDVSARRFGGVILLATGLIFAALLARWTVSLGGMNVFFWVFAAVAIFGSIRVITHKKPVYSALYFVLTVFASGGLFVLLWAEFMAAALVLIYAGAILITYVFVIMLASEATTGNVGAAAEVGDTEHDSHSREPLIASAIGFAIAGLLVFLIFHKSHEIAERAPHHGPALASSGDDLQVLKTGAPVEPHKAFDAGSLGSAQGLGQELIENQAVNVQLAAVILTLAMVGAITLARRRVIVSDDRGIVENVVSPHTPVDDNPHSIPVYGTDNPRHKAYPET